MSLPLSVTPNTGFAGSVPIFLHKNVVWGQTFIKFLPSFSSLPLNHSRKIVVSYKRKYVHEVQVNCLYKLAQEKIAVG